MLVDWETHGRACVAMGSAYASRVDDPGSTSW